MAKIVALLACASVTGAFLLTSVYACKGGDRPANAQSRPPDLTTTSRDGGTGGAGGVAGNGGSDGAVAASDLACTDVSGSQNMLTVNTTSSLMFDAQTAFSTFAPGPCSAIRSVTVGFDTDGCGLASGELLEFTISEDDIGVSVLQGAPLVIGNGSQPRIRLRGLNDGVSTEWGNCLGSSGTMTFTSLDLQPDGSLDGTFNATLTDCDQSNAPNATVIGRVVVDAPPECL